MTPLKLVVRPPSTDVVVMCALLSLLLEWLAPVTRAAAVTALPAPLELLELLDWPEPPDAEPPDELPEQPASARAPIAAEVRTRVVRRRTGRRWRMTGTPLRNGRPKSCHHKSRHAACARFSTELAGSALSGLGSGLRRDDVRCRWRGDGRRVAPVAVRHGHQIGLAVVAAGRHDLDRAVRAIEPDPKVAVAGDVLAHDVPELDGQPGLDCRPRDR